MTQKIDGGGASRPIENVTTGAASARSGTDRTAPVAAPEGDSLRLTGEAAGLQTLARELGSTPAGIDMAKVNAVRAAIADGRYTIDAGKIADRMLDLERNLAG